MNSRLLSVSAEREGRSRVRSLEGGDERHRLRQRPADRVWAYEQVLDSGTVSEGVVQIPKWRLPTLPDRFERTWLAKLPDGAIDSYRDMDSRVDSVHINEFPAYWELHIDSFNPHYYPVAHVCTDTEIAPELLDWAASVASFSARTAGRTTVVSGTLLEMTVLDPLRTSCSLLWATAGSVFEGVDQLLDGDDTTA